MPHGEAIASLIDHTLLRTEYTPADVDRVCAEALEHGFATVCVNPIYVPQIVERLESSPVKAASVVGFTLGAEFTAIKVEQARRLIEAGVEEMDMLLPVGLLRAGDYRAVFEDIAQVVKACHGQGVILKVILETGLLSLEEKIAGCLIAVKAGADYVKTCTGFAIGEATAEDIMLMRRIVGPAVGVKAAGGVRSWEKARLMVSAGASRIGATQGVVIVQQSVHEAGSDPTQS
jgi:deoxyribose-phosphate aldolase